MMKKLMVVLTALAVHAPITDGHAQISGSFDERSATVLAAQINAATPDFGFALKSVQR